MLISVTLKNWMSFRDPTTFSMVADENEKDHTDRLFYVKDYNIKLLPIAAIFGGNASGKSNFIKSVEFIQKLVQGEFSSTPIELYDSGTIENVATADIPVKPFKLDSTGATKPCEFTLSLWVNGYVYEYFLAIDRNEILHETLIKFPHHSNIHSKEAGTTQFSRAGKIFTVPRGSDLKINKNLEESLQRSMGLRKTFIQNLAENKESLFNPIGRVIATFDITFPNTAEISSDTSDTYYKKFGEFLADMDTGISEARLKLLEKGQYPEAERQIAEIVLQNQPIGKALPFSYAPDKPIRFFIKTKEGIIANELLTYHGGANEKPIEMGSGNESEGTRRLIDLAPLLFRLFSNDTQIVLVDELDRSLHSLLTRELVYLYLEKCNNKTQKQFIFTTHDSDLFEIDDLRLDEIRLARRLNDGNTILTSLADENITNRDNLRDNYLKGYFGGVPHIYGGDY